MKISNIEFEAAVRKILEWARAGEGRLIFCCTLNELAMADEDPVFKKKLLSADILTPDGMPLVWYLKWKYGKGERVYGPELLGAILNLKFEIFNEKGTNLLRSGAGRIDPSLTSLRKATAWQARRVRHLFIGDQKNKKFFEKFGEYIVMPMKKEFSQKDYDELAKELKRTKGQIVWLGLGARKQIETAYELKKRGINKVIITVGAAFDFVSGNKPQAPRWLRNAGGEWMYRLCREPKRLCGRYLKIIGFVASTIKKKWWVGSRQH